MVMEAMMRILPTSTQTPAAPAPAAAVAVATDTGESSVNDSGTAQAIFATQAQLKEDAATQQLEQTVISVIQSLAKNTNAQQLINIFQPTEPTDNNQEITPQDLAESLKNFTEEIKDKNFNGVREAFEKLPKLAQEALSAEFNQKGLTLLSQNFGPLAIGKLCQLPGMKDTVLESLAEISQNAKEDPPEITATQIDASTARGQKLAELTDKITAYVNGSDKNPEEMAAIQNILKKELTEIYKSADKQPVYKSEIATLTKTASEENTSSGEESKIHKNLMSYAKKMLGNKGFTAAVVGTLPVIAYLGASVGSRIPIFGKYIGMASKPILSLVNVSKDLLPYIAMMAMNGKSAPPAMQEKGEE